MAKKIKDKKIKILEERNIAEPGNMPKYEYVPIHPGTLWAYVRHLSAKEFYAAMAVQQEEQMLFVINWRDDIHESMEIEYKGQRYNITRIDTFEGYKRDIAIYASAGPAEGR